MADPSLILPQLVENMIMKICTDKQLDLPDSWARRRLAAVGEGVAADVLSKIYNQQTQIRDLSRLIVWYIDNPQSPIRVSSQQSSRSPVRHPQSPSNNPCQSSENLVGHPHQSPSNNPSPPKRASPSFCDYDHDSAASFPSNSGSSSFHMSRHPMPPLVPCSQMASSNNVSRQLSFSDEPEIRERRGPISHQLTVLSQLEFRKFFLLLCYIGRAKLEEVISADAADDIARRKDLPMTDFELQIWNTYGQHFCEKPDVRRQYADWESGRTCFYYCYVYEDGSRIFKGPCLNATKTHLQRELGDDNVLIVKFVGEGKHSVLKIAGEGIFVGLRHYRFFGEVFDPFSDCLKCSLVFLCSQSAALP